MDPTSTNHHHPNSLPTRISTDLAEFASMFSLLRRPLYTNGSWLMEHIPSSPFPTPYSHSHYDQALHLQSGMEHLITSMVSKPEDKLYKLLEFHKTQDKFIQKLVDIGEKYNRQERKQKI